MFEWLTFSSLIAALWGALGGAGVGLAFHISRDWQYLSHQWRLRRRLERGEDAYFEELRELEGYQPKPVTPEERAALPQTLGWFALVGAVLVLSIRNPDQTGWFVVLATMIVFQAIPVLRKRPADWKRLGELALWLVWVGFIAFGAEALSERIADWGVSPGAMLIAAGSLLGLFLMAMGAQYLRQGPPVEADAFEQRIWRTTAQILIFAPPAAIALVAMIALTF